MDKLIQHIKDAIELDQEGLEVGDILDEILEMAENLKLELE
ncbi:hypothetical protein AXJ10_gp57 [Gordonia phage GordTnk2]|uniref:Uncharacterized protein n=2 Tax=Gordtnkvirus gordtnk2 TaxID=1982219 RepID=A0A0E3T6V1_9CAUD|nr:hypothetical protein AXJ11_gp56 [Gordonia phage GordDuk1]YP_009223965.1 hypothetical protein AXJ10_gp57 [Gordonia phage GordTnk2]AKC02797.1 hypothetical protein GordTnk2_57 [Gordonia phage GordTnk2]AKC02984.1 hypothetical protein GordDuk1_56 [Gordonia phage GordDuk1]